MLWGDVGEEMSDDLKPCPFCKGKAIKIPDANHSTGWEVGCFSEKCDVEPHVWADHLETAMMQWNTRADADRIEGLERERDAYAEHLMVAANTFSEMHLEIEQLRDKISEMQARINRLTLGGNRR